MNGSEAKSASGRFFRLVASRAFLLRLALQPLRTLSRLASSKLNQPPTLKCPGGGTAARPDNVWTRVSVDPEERRIARWTWVREGCDYRDYAVRLITCRALLERR